MREGADILKKNLIIARNRKGWTQKDLSENVGFSVDTISRWERGERSPKLEDLKKIARVLDITLDELTEEVKVYGRVTPIKLEIEPFAAVVGLAMELAENSTHDERVRAAKMLRRAINALELSEEDLSNEPKSDGVVA